MWKYRAAMAAVFLCVGLMLLPPLAALNLSVWLACPRLNSAGCVALFLVTTDL